MISYIYSLAQDEKKGIVASFLKLILLLLSFVYICITALIKTVYRLKLLRPARIDCKVISVGNITLGGTGKTPFVKMLIRHLTDKGRKAAILIRGYKRKVPRSRLLSEQPESQIVNYRTMGDEAYLLVKDTGVPVFAGRDRIKTGRETLDRHSSDTIILDDGFQHWRLHRDLDIVLINSINPFGNNKVIPRGILREPISSLKRADILVLTKTDLAENSLELKNRLKAVNPKALIIETRHKPVYLSNLEDERFDLSEIKDKEVCIFSAIADVYSFQKLILNLGAKIKLKFEFPDHYNWRKQDLDKIASDCKTAGIKTVITTKKDAVKIGPLWSGTSIRLLILTIELEITKNEQDFYSRLYSI